MFSFRAKAIFSAQQLWLFKGLIIFGMLLWQLSLIGTQISLPLDRRIYHACGIGCGYDAVYAKAATFFYFTNEFPVIRLGQPESYDASYVKDSLGNSNALLANDENFAIRSGEWSRVWLFFPSLLLGETKALSVTPVMIGLFIFASFIWMWGLTLNGQTLFGALTIYFLTNSEPVLFEVYSNPNLFSLPITVFLFLGGLSSAVFSSRLPRWVEVTSLVFASLLMAFIRDIRAEPFATMALFGLLLLFLKKPIKQGLLYSVLFFGILFGSHLVQQKYWENKFQSAVAFVKMHNGSPFPENAVKQAHHELWHPLLCGLGDYDKKYGFTWNDIIVYGKVLPILQNEYKIFPKWEHGYTLNDWWDSNKVYEKRFNEINEYHVVAQKMFKDLITNDPSWYLDILLNRIKALGQKISPIELNLIFDKVSWQINGLCLLLLSIVFGVGVQLYTKKDLTSYVVLALLALSISAPSLIVTTANGATFGAIYQYVALSFLLTIIYQTFTTWFIKNDIQH